MKAFSFTSFVPLFLKVYVALVPLFVFVMLNLNERADLSFVLFGSVLASVLLWASIFLFKILKPSFPNLLFAALGIVWVMLCMALFRAQPK